MFTRSLLRIPLNGAAPAVAGHLQAGPTLGAAAQVRNVATLKSLSARMKAIKNMQKITKAMKMVSAAKLRGDQNRLEQGEPFAAPALKLFERLPREEKPGTMHILAMTSDKGLCGGVNTAVNKGCRDVILTNEGAGNTVKYMNMGGKGGTAMKRVFGDRFTHSFEELAKCPWNFATASIIADRLIAQNPPRLTVLYNQFRNIVSYDTQRAHVITKDEAKSLDKVEWSKALDVYTFEPSIFEVWDDLHEWYYASVVFNGYLNSLVCEQAQRMSAMENASKNAGEVLEKVTLQYNRARQAKITTELCEIISGASAV